MQLHSLSDPQTPAEFLVNGIFHATNANSDTVSGAGNLHSSIAMVGAINSMAWHTGVTADVEETIVHLSDISEKDLPDHIGTSSAWKFAINEVPLDGFVSTLGNFVDVVNNYSGSTGVKARFESGSTYRVELYATDGRNIELAGNMTSILGVSPGTYYGSLKLSSSKEFEIENVSSGLLEASQSLFVDQVLYDFFSTSIATQESAQNSLRVVDTVLQKLNQSRIQASEAALFCR